MKFNIVCVFCIITDSMLKNPFSKKAGHLSSNSSVHDASSQMRCTIRCLDDAVSPVVLNFKVMYIISVSVVQKFKRYR